MKVVKILAGVIGLMLVLVVAAAVILPLVLDPNDYKDRIQALAKEHTGRDLNIEGDMNLTVFPWLGVKVGNVSFGNAAGFKPANFAELDAMQVRVKLLPLLSRELEMDTVEIDGLHLELAKDSAGTTNWDDLAKTQPASGASSSTSASSTGDAPPLAALAIGGVNLRNASVNWNDATSGQLIKVQNLQAQSGEVSLGQPVSLSLSFDVSELAPGIGGHVETKADIAVTPGQSTISISAVDFLARLQGQGLPNGKAEITGGADKGSFDSESQKGSLSGLQVSAKGVAVGAASADVNLTGSADFDLGQQIVSLAGINIDGQVTGNGIPGGALPFKLNTTGRLDLAQQSLGLGELNLSLPTIKSGGVQGNLDVSASLAGQLSEQRFKLDVQKLSGHFEGKGLPDGKLDVNASSEIDLDLANQTLAVSKLVLTAANLKGQADAKITKLLSDPSATGSLDFAEFSPRALMALAGQAPPKTSDPKALTSASLATNFTASPGSVSLDSLNLRLDDSRIKGKVSVPDLTKQALAFDLVIDTLNTDRYLPAPAPAAKQTQTASQSTPATPGAAAASAAQLPVETLRALDLNGRLRVGKLQAQQLELAKVDFGLTAKGGLIEVDPLTAVLYGGTYKGAMKLDARGKTASLSVDESLSGVRADELLAALKIDPGVNLSGGRSTVTLKANATGDTVEQQFTFKKLGVSADLAGKDFPNGRLQFGLGADVDVDVKSQTLNADNLQVSFAGAKVNGTVAVQKFLANPSYVANLSLPNFDPRKVLAALGQSAPATADRRALGSAALKVKATGSTNNVRLDDIDLKVDQSHLVGTLSVANFADPAIVFNLSVDEVDADRYLPPGDGSAARVEAPTRTASKAPSKPRKATKGIGTTGIGTTGIGTTGIGTTGIGTTGIGTTGIGTSGIGSSSGTSTQAQRAPEAAQPQRSGGIASPGAAAVLLPADMLRSLNLDGELRVGSLKINRLHLSKVVFKAKAKEGQLSLNPLNASLYQGSYSGDVKIDARGKQPKISFNEQLRDVQAGPLLKDMNGSAALTGRTNATMSGSAIGQSENALRKSLTGNAEFSFRDGAVQGVDLFNMICGGLGGLGGLGSGGKLDAKALLGGIIQGIGKQAARSSAGSTQDSGGGTRFAELTGTVQITNGLASNRDLNMRSPLLRVSGEGQANLVNERLDYLANARLVGSCDGQGAVDSNVSGIDIPVRISGTFSKPKYEPQLSGLINALGKRPQPVSTQQPAQPAQPATTTTAPPASNDPKDALKGILKGGLKGILGN